MGNRFAIPRFRPGADSISASALNRLAEATNATRTTPTGSSIGYDLPNGSTVFTPRQRRAVDTSVDNSLCAYNITPGDITSGVRVAAGYVVLDILTTELSGIEEPAAFAVDEWTDATASESGTVVLWIDLPNIGASITDAGICWSTDLPTVTTDCFRRIVAVADVDYGRITRRYAGGDFRIVLGNYPTTDTVAP